MVSDFSVMKRYLFIFLLTTFKFSTAQVPDWSTSIANLVYTNCSSCHHNGGIAPFPLTSYNDAVSNAFSIKTKVQNRSMPPWPADPAYRHFAYEMVLDSLEIAAISDWVDNGTPLGNIALEPPAPVFNQTGSLLDTIHMTLQIPPYTLQLNSDEYRYYAFHSGFTDTVYISKIEVIPGLKQFIHHADIHYDLSGQSYYNDSITPVSGFTSGIISDYYMNAWQPGGNIAEYPAGWGIAVPPGADFVFEIHYGPGGMGQTDTTRMNLQFITNPVNVRPVKVGWLLNNPIPSQGPLIIPPNQISTFNQQSQIMPVDRSLISISPHMHMLGKSYKVWFIASNGDSVPLIDIPKWDFHWQKYYMFQQVQKIPAGARIYSIASYDNTVNNPHNPNFPPQTVTYGPTTHDEMLMTYFIYADYEPGDEFITLDSTLLTGINETDRIYNVKVYPNPADNFITVTLPAGSDVHKYEVLNVSGQILKSGRLKSRESEFNINTSDLNEGFYILHCTSEEGLFISKFIKQD